MGTTLHARVELLFAAVPTYDVPERWELVSEWWFQKDYLLQIALSEHPRMRKDWPSDVHRQPGDDLREGRRWMLGRDAVELGEQRAGPSLPLQSFLGSLRQLMSVVTSERVRVLFWHG